MCGISMERCRKSNLFPVPNYMKYYNIGWWPLAPGSSVFLQPRTPPPPAPQKKNNKQTKKP